MNLRRYQYLLLIAGVAVAASIVMTYFAQGFEGNSQFSTIGNILPGTEWMNLHKVLLMLLGK